MARYKDSNEIAALKKEATQSFVALVEAHCKLGNKVLEEKLCIGTFTGSVWCDYRNGKKKMLLSTLNSKIKIAVEKGILDSQVAGKFHSEVADKEFKIEIAKYASENYVYNPRPFELEEFSSDVNKLVMQANRLDKDHQAKDILTTLLPLQELIRDLSSRKNEPVKPLKPKESAEVLFTREVEEKWGAMVPESAVCKLFDGKDHGLEIINGSATSLSVAHKMAAMRKDALDSTNLG